MATLPRFHEPYEARPALRAVRPLLAPVPRFDADAAIGVIAAGGIAILAEGTAADVPISLVAAARDVSDAVVNRMASDARGLVTMPISPAQARQIGLEAMSDSPGNPRCAGYARSIEALDGVSTGISAADRAVTMGVAAAAGARSSDLVSPGHVFPIITHERGLIGRFGAAEAAVELVRLAGRGPAAVLCRVLRDDGEAATLADLADLRPIRALEIADIATLLAARCERSALVRRLSPARPAGGDGLRRMVAYAGIDDERRHYAIVHGPRVDAERSTVRICAAEDSLDTLAALTTVMDGSLAEPGSLLILVSGGGGCGGEIVADAIARQILDDMLHHG